MWNNHIKRMIIQTYKFLNTCQLRWPWEISRLTFPFSKIQNARSTFNHANWLFFKSYKTNSPTHLLLKYYFSIHTQPIQKIRYENNKYLHCIEYFWMINSNRRYWVSCTLRARNVKNPILPVARLSFTISECVHSKPLPSTLMPCSFIPMPICKLIDPKSMHLVCKIFSSIRVPIPK